MKRSTKITSSTATHRNALVALAVVVALAGAAGAEQQTPSQVVDGLASQVLPILQDSSLNAEQKRQRVEEIAYRAMDFNTLSKLVLARNWSKFSPAQQAEFEQEFKRHLSVTYGNNIENYNNERVQILGERPEARGDMTVQTKILRGGHSADVVVDYRLRQRDGQWKIIDVIVENVSLVSNFRSQFQDLLGSNTPAQLIALIHEKNERGEAFPGAPKAKT